MLAKITGCMLIVEHSSSAEGWYMAARMAERDIADEAGPVPAEQLRVGVVGLGLIAQAVHLPNLRLLGGRFRVTHVCDLSPRLAAEIGSGLPRSRTSTDWRAVCQDPDVDAILLLTPHGAHAP